MIQQRKPAILQATKQSVKNNYHPHQLQLQQQLQHQQQLQQQFHHAPPYQARQKTYSPQIKTEKIDPKLNRSTEYQLHQQQQQFRPIKPMVKSPPAYGSSANNSINNPSSQNDTKEGIEIDINELLVDGGPKFLQLDHYKNFIPPIYKVNEKHYIDDNLASNAYSKSKSRRNFAAHLAKLVFTPRERLESNCNGRFGKKALDSMRLSAIRNTLFKFYPCQPSLILNGDITSYTSGDHDENNVWIRDCIPAIDESNRVLKKQLIAWYKKNRMNNSTYPGAVSSYYPNNTNTSINFDANGEDEQIDDDFEINV